MIFNIIDKCELSQEADAEVKMRVLYDSVIQYKDIDGGAWKQGYPIRYDERDMTRKTLNVFLVPHSHNDPGWIKTFLEYFETQTRNILNTVVASLEEVIQFLMCGEMNDMRHYIPSHSIISPTGSKKNIYLGRDFVFLHLVE